MTTPRDDDKRKIPSALSFAFGVYVAALGLLTPSMTETAVANGDTRTIYLHHAHTGEDIAATYLVNGQYDSRVLQQLNWFLRDWRRDEPTNMDPRLFDVVWEAYRSAGAGNQIINVVSAYRSPETNAMLRARSRAVAKYSQHMLGKAMDTTMPGMPMSHVREIGMRMQRGGVGYYPNANTPFVHLDVGNVRSWPRMSYEQLVRLFPDGKTVHLPTNGQPLPGYEEARAEIEARGNGAYVTAPRRTFGGFLASLFGMSSGEDEDAEIAAPAPSTRKQWGLAPRRGRAAEMQATADEEGGTVEQPQPTARRGRNQIARAEADLPRGETGMTATGAVGFAPASASRAPMTAAPPAESEEAPAEAQPQPEKKARKAKVPLPPANRPASLEKPTPLDERPAADVAVLEAGQQGVHAAGESQETEAEPAPAAARRFVKAPTPPRRPSALAAASDETEAPKERASAAGEGTESGARDDAALAYAPPAHRHAANPASGAEGRQADFVPARLDRSNFHALTAAPPATRASTRAPVTAVRAAGRAADPSALLPPARPAHLVGFATTNSPPPDKFAPGAPRPAAKADPNQKK